MNARSIPNNKIRITREIKSFNDVSLTDIVSYMQKYGHLEAAKQIDKAGGNAPVDEETIVKNGIKHLQKYLGVKETGEPDEETKKAVIAPRCGISDIQNIMDPDTGLPYQWESNKRNLTYAFYAFNPKLDKSVQRMAIRVAFNRWASISPFKFREVTGITGITPDILVGFFSRCHDDPDCFDGPLGVLAHGYYPEDGHLHFDLDEHWKYPGSEADKLELSMGKYIDLLEIATHESGHVLGVDHIPNTESIMFARYFPSNDSSGNYIIKKLHKLDIESIQSIYGAGTGSPSRGPPILPNRTTEQPESTTIEQKEVTSEPKTTIKTNAPTLNSESVAGASTCVKVKLGDSMWKICTEQFGLSLEDCLARNPLIKNPDMIYPGQKICS